MPKFADVEFLADRKERLDRFLARVLPEHSRSRIAKHIADAGAQVVGKPRKASFIVEPGMRVEVSPISPLPPHDLGPIDIPISVVFEDEFLLVVDKPPGFAIHPSSTSQQPTLVNALLAHSSALSNVSGSFRPGIVHRLDKDTSGLLIVAKTDAVHRVLQAAIQERRVTRIYRAWVRGKPDQSEFTIKTYIGRNPRNRKKMAVVSESAADARLAVTHCKLLESAHGVSQIECKLETGRTHQIRVHLASVGLPVLGDPLYGVKWGGIERQALHAERLMFVHPVTGTRLDLRAPIPDDLGRICP